MAPYPTTTLCEDCVSLITIVEINLIQTTSQKTAFKLYGFNSLLNVMRTKWVKA